MTAPMVTTEQLVAVLDAAGVLPVAWKDAFLAVPQHTFLHTFLPAKLWVDDGEGEPQPIDQDIDPDRWREAAYANVAIVTQFDDGATVWPAIGTHRTSSAFELAMVAPCWIVWTYSRVSGFSKSGPLPATVALPPL
jgi:hypothetical protein